MQISRHFQHSPGVQGRWFHIVHGQSIVKELKELPVGSESIPVQKFTKLIQGDLDGVAISLDTDRPINDAKTVVFS